MILLLLALLLAPALAQPAPPNPPRGEFRAVIFSDFNGAYGALDYPPPVARIVAAILGVWQPDVVLSAGDVVAGQNAALPDERFLEMWCVFDDQVAAPLRAAGVPFAMTVGNHDGSKLPGFERERAAARTFWAAHLPDLDFLDADDFPFHYAFSHGGVFVAAWDASSAAITADQQAWLAAHLATPEAVGARYRILLGHLPLYGVSEGRNRPGEVLAEGDALRQWLEALGVDLYVSGHHAAYYPGMVGGLTLLHSGGVGARRLLGDGRPGRSAVTVLDLDFDPPRLRLATFDPSDFSEILLESLPPFLDGLNGMVTRLEPGAP